MSAFNEKDGVLNVDQVSLAGIAREFGTPTYVYSASSIRDQYEKLSGALKKALPADRQPLICYACKANSHIAILSLLKSLGSSIEVVSEGELIRALKAGFDPQKIVSEGVGKSKAGITAALSANIHQFNVESLGELELIDQLAGEMGKVANVVFRLNPDIVGGGHDKISTGRKSDKFGMVLNYVQQGFEKAKSLKNVKAIGIFVHMGSQISKAENFEALFKKVAGVVGELRTQGHTIERLDIGGGFPIVYKDEQLLDLDVYAGLVRDIIAPLDTEIILEPGRYLVGNAGVLLTEVLYVKETDDRTFLIVDAAMNDLMRPALYDSWHGIEAVKNRNAPKKTYDIAGPVCESSDIFARERSLPAMKPGDIAVLKSTGAYGFCMASNYNTRLLPPEILVDGDKVALIRPRQTYDDLIGPEKIPDWLK
jgi:diaminopimelate decarboxylase